MSGLTIFVLVKFSRYREFGNDLSAFIISMYFFLNILEYVLNNKIKNYFLVWSPLIILIIFSHKISYVFVGLLYLILMNKINIKKQIKNITFMLVSFLFLYSWFGKNIAHTSCFFYPIETTCIKKRLQKNPLF